MLWFVLFHLLFTQTNRIVDADENVMVLFFFCLTLLLLLLLMMMIVVGGVLNMITSHDSRHHKQV